VCRLNSKTRLFSNSATEELLAHAVVIARDRTICVLILACFTSVLAVLNNFTVIASFVIAILFYGITIVKLCHSVQNILSSRLLSKNLKIKIYRTTILPVVLYGCETWSLTLRGGKEVQGVSEQGVEENIWT